MEKKKKVDVKRKWDENVGVDRVSIGKGKRRKTKENKKRLNPCSKGAANLDTILLYK